MTYYSFIKTAADNLLLLADTHFLTGVYVLNQKYFPEIQKNWFLNNDLEIFKETTKQLNEYFAGSRYSFNIEYKLNGTKLQELVWNRLVEIEYGKTISYKELAQEILYPTAVRAVATAVGYNPFTFIIPCHRVIGKDGKLRGYASGLDLKQRLLDFEMSKSSPFL
ncbi:methylated-DNA--[protein]-cysteine S-methyltransferase [Candidatus Tisiphia endosymbiont of Sialis lutaria]|uniref:methylated-DNA--[protein]-cysteine S-methyltransferase n=1 Tax=Candidatus Tisiphia endosymbiont of Sialis lutaria TaxID=2029164 RepID=UPI00312C9377